MKSKILGSLFCLVFMGLSSSILGIKLPVFAASSNFSISPAEHSPQIKKKPKYHYMESLLERGTNPLGLKENLALKKYLEQSSIKWAIRAGKKHILN